MSVLAVGFIVAVTPPVVAAVDKGRSNSFLEDARQYLEKGDRSAAIIQLKNSLQNDPGNVAARLLLGRTYLDVGNGPAAEKEFKAARRRGAKGVQLSIDLGRAYMLQRKFEAVLREVKDDVAAADTRAKALLLRGRAFLALMRIKEATSAFREADRLAPSDVLARVGLARTLIVQRKLKAAEAEIDTALSRNPKSLEALALKGELRRLDHDLKGAVRYFNRAISLKSTYVVARLGRAAALIDLNRDTEAMADLQAVFQRIPRYPVAIYLSALVLSKRKDFAGARDALQSARGTLDDHMPSVFLHGAVSFALNQYEQAIRHLNKYVERVPDNKRARRLLGAAHVRNRDPRRAIEVLSVLDREGKADAQILTLLGSANMQLRRFNEGTKYFERAAALAPNAAGVRTQLALGNIVRGQQGSAVAELERALDLDPESRRAAVLLTLVHLRGRNFDEALKTARRLKKLMPDNPLPANLLGAAYLGKGDQAAARKTFRETLRRNPDYHSARMNLARLDFRSAKYDAAEAHYRTILDKSPTHLGAMIGMAEISAQRKKHQAAVDWLRKAGNANPKSPEPRLRLISYYLSRKEVSRAATEARALNQEIPNNPKIVATLARVEGLNGDHVAAVAAYRRLSALRPNSPAVLLRLAAAQVRAKNPSAARKTLKRAVDLDSSALPSRVALARFEIGQKNYSEARRQTDEILSRWPKLATGDVLVGDIYMRQKKYAEAAAAYNKGMTKQKSGQLALRRFRARRLSEGVDGALAELQKWVDANDDRRTRHVLAGAYLTANRTNQALREYERLYKKEKTNPVLLNNLAWLYFQKGDSRAVEFAERAHKRAPSSAAVMDTLAWILIDKGQNRRALELLKKANGLAPRHGEIRYHLAVALHRTGDSRNARRELEDLLNSKVKFRSADDARALLETLRGS